MVDGLPSAAVVYLARREPTETQKRGWARRPAGIGGALSQARASRLGLLFFVFPRSRMALKDPTIARREHTETLKHGGGHGGQRELAEITYGTQRPNYSTTRTHRNPETGAGTAARGN